MNGFGVLLIVSLAACPALSFGAGRPSRVMVGGALLLIAPAAWLLGHGLVQVFADNQPRLFTRGEWVTVLRWLQLLLWVAPFAAGLILMRQARGSARSPVTPIPD